MEKTDSTWPLLKWTQTTPKKRRGKSSIQPLPGTTMVRCSICLLHAMVRVRYGGIRRSSASPLPPCDSTTSASVWPSPRQTPGPSCPCPSDEPPRAATTKHAVAPRHGQVQPLGSQQDRIRWAGFSVESHHMLIETKLALTLTQKSARTSTSRKQFQDC